MVNLTSALGRAVFTVIWRLCRSQDTHTSCGSPSSTEVSRRKVSRKWACVYTRRPAHPPLTKSRRYGLLQHLRGAGVAFIFCSVEADHNNKDRIYNFRFLLEPICNNNTIDEIYLTYCKNGVLVLQYDGGIAYIKIKSIHVNRDMHLSLSRRFDTYLDTGASIWYSNDTF